MHGIYLLVQQDKAKQLFFDRVKMVFFDSMVKNLISVAAVITIVLTACGPLKPEAEKKSPPNFIVIYTDEMQFSDLGCYGGEIPTPNIDQLASEGILFTNAYTVASMCTPSRYSVLAGQFPGRCTAPSFKKENPIGQPYNIAWNSWITADKKTLPRVLSENGFVTGMAGKWHVGRISDKTVLPAFLPDEDLDHPDIQAKLTEEQSVYQGLVETQGGFDEASSVVWENYDGHSLKAMRFHNFPWMVKGALTFLEKHKRSSKPFFLYFAPTAVHGPNHVADLSKDMTYTPGGRDTTLQGLSIDVTSLNEQLSLADPKTRHRYTGMAQTDHAVRLIREKLADTGLDHNTVIVFISDHNVEPGKATSFEKGIRVPMIIYWPGMMPGRISKSLVQNIDIYPTILEAAGIELPEDYKLDGVSMLPIISDPNTSTRDFIFSENGYTRSVSDGTYKYIALRYPGPLIRKMESGELDHVPSYVKAWPQPHSALAMNGFPHYFDQDQLYNLKDDPYEQHNLYETMSSSGELTLLVDALENHLQSFDYPFDLARIPFMETVEYRELTKKNLAFDLLSIPWLRRDHGFILWPPEQE
jgi:arylsulfatase A-like enzyme